MPIDNAIPPKYEYKETKLLKQKENVNWAFTFPEVVKTFILYDTHIGKGVCWENLQLQGRF